MVRLTGERAIADLALDGDFEGEAEADVDKDREKPTSSRLAAKRTESNTKRACSPKFRTFVAVSLFAPARAADMDVDTGPEDAPDPDLDCVGVMCALRAERICAGETTSGGVLSGFESWSAGNGLEAEISIAPLRTSNSDRTSPV